MHKGVKAGIAVVTAVMFTGGGVAAYNLWNGVTGGNVASTARPSGPAAEAPSAERLAAEAPTAELATEGAKAFLAAWAKGDYQEAGRYTDRPADAVAALTAFRDTLHPTALALTPADVKPGAVPTNSASGTQSVPVTFHAEVGVPGAAGPWAYDGVAPMVRTAGGRAVVHWDPVVVHPMLKPGRTLAVRPVASSAAQILDRKGRPLAEFPSVAAVAGQIKFGAGEPKSQAGQGVVVTDKGNPAVAEALFTITEPTGGERRLTLDADLQRAAETAVRARSGPSSIVAIEPSTGHILAFANNPTHGQNRAFGATIAPGSTLKVVTAAALLESGLTLDAPLSCPVGADVGGRTVQNDFSEPHPEYTFKDDFAKSCNTAFLAAGKARLQAGTLSATAKDVFGLGAVWDTGLSSFDTKIPVETNQEQILMAYIGQGRVQTNALAMASVSATVQSGVFRQPILVPGLAQPKAGRVLSGAVLGDLRTMMRRTAQSGTAAQALAGIAGAAGKTGTAEVGGQTLPNSWFTGYRGDLAVAAEVEAGGHGAAAATPAAAGLLAIGNVK
ncbi:hypothetical protein F4556_007331 [Kitasatospora gansuensis]|uniref:Penicillin-binding protein n=1 Tax=Kitasatospora gansuensis TaxID=258050 RepID=A0A7W7WLT7_9ACTN|nr:penicillin-binding transpeptidase domain-containing protein [Kitasatospora gansuensis]MBB4951796.1 hypothetical protein [Kitasatospora gansuensis]